MKIIFKNSWGGYGVDIHAKENEKPIIKVGKEVLTEGVDYEIEEEGKGVIEIIQSTVSGVVKLN